LFGPTDVTCAGPPVFTSSAALSGGTAQSGSFTPTAAGFYRWMATYECDDRNASVSGTCGDPTEATAVAQALPVISTTASADIALGAGQLSDEVTLTGLANPTAPQTVTFRLFGPADATCASAPVFTSVVVLTGGTAQSAAFTPAATGTYRWIASYDGDANNLPASGTCGDPTENTEVTGAPRILPPAGTAVNWILVLAMSIVVVGGFMVTVARRKLA
jgi:hypothetical protein